MDLELDETQTAIVSSVRTILGRLAGPTRARELGPAGFDEALADALRDAGFLDLATSADAGVLAAALVVEEVSRAAGAFDVGMEAVIGPMVLGDERPSRLAITTDRSRGPVRFAPGAEALLVVGDDDVKLHSLADGVVEPVETVYGYPFGHVDWDPAKGRSLGSATAALARSAWRVALAAEAAGALQAALDHTVEHLSGRHQFGKPLGSLQAVQHRLAEAHVWVQGSVWLARAAAWRSDDFAVSACAATHAAQTIKAVAADLHQLSGAIGFTTEFDLHVWTTRLWALRVEMGGGREHAIDLARRRWSGVGAEQLTKGA